MRVLVACEMSGIVRRAFRERGHDAWSCDLQEAEDESRYHLMGDVRDWLGEGWDLMIAHPPCTDLAASGARWWAEKGEERKREALGLFRKLLLFSRIDRVCVENPVGRASTEVMPATQIVQPWMFGDMECKATCLWLRGLPELRPTRMVAGIRESTWRMGQSARRSVDRSRTFPGLAAAMADQWGSLD